MGTGAAQVAEVRRDIARSRGELSETIEALEQRLSETRESVVDKVSPKRVWQRKTAGARQKLDDVSTSLAAMTGRTEDKMARSRTTMGNQAQQLSSRAEGTAASLGDSARAAGPAVRDRTESNPMAAGLVALGAGFLVAALLPPSERERQAAARVQSQLQPLKEQAREAGRAVAGELQQSAQGSVEEVKGRASEAVQHVKEETTSSAQHVKGEAEEAGTSVKQRARTASRQVKQTSTGAATPTRPRRAPRRAASRSGS